MQRVGKTLSAAVTAPLVGMGAAGLNAAGDFEEAMNRVAAISGITADKSDKAFSQIQDKAMELGQTTEYSSREAANAFEYFAQKGFEVNQMLDAAGPTLDLATAASASLGQTAEFTSDIMRQFGKDASDLPKIGDQIAKTFTTSGASFDSLRQAMSYVGPTAAQLGISFEEVSAAMAVMGNQGIRGSKAGTSLNAAMKGLIKKASELGIQTVTTEGKLRPLGDLIEEIGAKGLSAAELTEIFGVRAQRAISALSADGGESLRQFTKDIEGAEGASEKAASTMRQGFNYQLKQLGSSLENLAITVASTGLLDFATKAVERFRMFVNELQEANPQLLQLGVAASAAAAAVGPMIWIGGQMVSAWAALSPVIASAGSAVAGITGTFGSAIGTMTSLSSTVGALASVFASPAMLAIGSVATLAYTRWEDFKDALAGPVMDSFSQVKRMVKGVMNVVWRSTKDVLGSVEDLWNSWVGDTVLYLLEHFADAAKSIFLPTLRQIGNTLSTVAKIGADSIGLIVDILTGDFAGAWKRVKNIVGSVFKYIRRSIANTIERITGMLEAIVGWVPGVSQALDGLQSILAGIAGDYDVNVNVNQNGDIPSYYHPDKETGSTSGSASGENAGGVETPTIPTVPTNNNTQPGSGERGRFTRSDGSLFIPDMDNIKAKAKEASGVLKNMMPETLDASGVMEKTAARVQYLKEEMRLAVT